MKNIVFTAARRRGAAVRDLSFKINDLRPFSLNCPRGPDIHGPRPAGPCGPMALHFCKARTVPVHICFAILQRLMHRGPRIMDPAQRAKYIGPRIARRGPASFTGPVDDSPASAHKKAQPLGWAGSGQDLSAQLII